MRLHWGAAKPDFLGRGNWIETPFQGIFPFEARRTSHRVVALANPRLVRDDASSRGLLSVAMTSIRIEKKCQSVNFYTFA
jgi:hypothetical protein